jgi:membrane-associated phospholipid phosphatase
MMEEVSAEKPHNLLLSTINASLFPFVTSRDSNNVIVYFQRLCGVKPDGTIENKACYAYFKLASACGEEIFSFLPLLLWFAIPLSSAFLTNFLFLLMGGQIIKDLLKLPRPSSVGTGILKLGDNHFETEYGFPSTHTMTGYLPFSFFLSLARNGADVGLAYWTFCVIYMLSMALSRLYLGVHSLLDVVAGLVLGGLITYALHIFGDEYFDAIVYNRSEGIIITIITVISFTLFYPRPRPWRAGFGTSAQVVGSWAGGASALWFLTHWQPQLLQVLLSISLVQILDEEGGSGKTMRWREAPSGVQLLGLLSVAALISGLAKVCVKAVASKILLLLVKSFHRLQPPEQEKVDSLGSPVPDHKAYAVEVPVR